jgi:hypothetical protein
MDDQDGGLVRFGHAAEHVVGESAPDRGEVLADALGYVTDAVLLTYHVPARRQPSERTGRAAYPRKSGRDTRFTFHVGMVNWSWSETSATLAIVHIGQSKRIMLA